MEDEIVSMQSLGGSARAEKLTPDERREIAKKAARQRWMYGGVRPVNASHVGTIRIGDLELACANLPDGRRVISEAAMMQALGRGYSGYYSQRDSAVDDGSAVVPRYLAPKVLKPYITDDLSFLQVIPYRTTTGAIAKGVNAEDVPKICKIWMKAREDGKLSQVQLRTAQKAEMIVLALAHTGIIALIDEATGYQEVRDKNALQAILDRYLAKEFAAWAKKFPDEFYHEIFRLRQWTWKGMRVNRPQCVATYTNDLIYARLAPGILQELEARNPVKENGRRVSKHFQWLTNDVGHPALAQHLHAIIGFMRASDTWDEMMHLVNRAFPKRKDTLGMDLFKGINFSGE